MASNDLEECPRCKKSVQIKCTEFLHPLYPETYHKCRPC